MTGHKNVRGLGTGRLRARAGGRWEAEEGTEKERQPRFGSGMMMIKEREGGGQG